VRPQGVKRGQESQDCFCRGLRDLQALVAMPRGACPDGKRVAKTRNNDQVHAAGACDVDFKTDVAARSRATPSSGFFREVILRTMRFTFSRLWYGAIARFVAIPRLG
jgi:hypothetical protein